MSDADSLPVLRVGNQLGSAIQIVNLHYGVVNFLAHFLTEHEEFIDSVIALKVPSFGYFGVCAHEVVLRRGSTGRRSRVPGRVLLVLISTVLNEVQVLLFLFLMEDGIDRFELHSLWLDGHMHLAHGV